MQHPLTHEQLTESAAAYALGILDEEERGAFERHLPECQACQAEVESFREAVGMLGYAAPAAVPPNDAALRDRILQRARGVRPISSSRSERARGSRLAWTAAAASFVVAWLAGLAYRSERSRLTGLERELAAASTELAARDSMIAAFLGPEVHVVSLAQPQGKPAVRVFWNHTRNVFIVTAFALPPAPAGKTYQLWAIAEGKQPVSMGTFSPDASGRATAIIPVASAIVDTGFIDNCGLTLEPAGGSSQPTESPRLIGAWRHVD